MVNKVSWMKWIKRSNMHTKQPVSAIPLLYFDLLHLIFERKASAGVDCYIYMLAIHALCRLQIIAKLS